MKHTESYEVRVTTPSGEIVSKPHEDVKEALTHYEVSRLTIIPGASVELLRHSTVSMALTIKAR